MKKKLLMEIIAAILCIAIVFAFSAYVGYVYMPERTSFGALWNMFKNEDEDSIDILFTGSSMAYCDVIPSVIYEKTGYTSYVLAGPEMTFSISYYYLEEAFKKQSPSVVMLEASGAFFDKYQNYSKVNIGYMPYDTERFKATVFAAEKEERWGLVFPMYNYHSMWQDVPVSQLFTKRSDDRIDMKAGYTYLTDCKAQDGRSVRDLAFKQEDFDYNCKYLDKIKALCDKNGAELILFFVPSAQYPSDELMDKFYDRAQVITVIDYNDQSLFDTVGIDMTTDYYDALHFNYSGAVKFSEAISEYINGNVKVSKHAHDDDLWTRRTELDYADSE